MTVLRHALRPGAYHDSIVLMQLRATLEEEPGVAEAGAVMGTPENLALLEASGLLPDLPEPPRASDLLVVVRAESAETAAAALARIEELLERDRQGATEGYRPRGLGGAVRLLPAARWVLVSVPGRFAAGVAREALGLGRHVFLFSDNVPLEREVELKRRGRSRGLLVMGPDCGTAILRGVGFGFANRVRRGGVGIVAASGTGLQAVACGIHARGGGISHAIGTGGRDLSADVGGTTALQALDLLARDPETRTIVLVSKPPAPAVAARLLAAAGGAGKPVVACFVGHDHSSGSRGAGSGGLRFARSLSHAASLAVSLSGREAELPSSGGAGGPGPADVPAPGSVRAEGGEPRGGDEPGREPLRRFLRGLFAGGTLAHEALRAAAGFLVPGSLYSNLEAEGARALADPWRGRGHTILDLGADVFTAGRLHPMLDEDARIRRLRQEAADADVGLLLLDVVLGDGAHPDPAAELAPAIETVRADRELEVVVVLIGTDRDPQDVEDQAARLTRAGARVFRDVDGAMEHVRRRLAPGPGAPGGEAPDAPPGGGADAGRVVGPGAEKWAGESGAGRGGESVPVDPGALRSPVAAINVGLEAFHRSLVDQGVRAVHVDWRPPAGGDARLAAALEKLRS